MLLPKFFLDSTHLNPVYVTGGVLAAATAAGDVQTAS
jgi:hypothetical protein